MKALGLEVKARPKRLLVACVYRPPLWLPRLLWSFKLDPQMYMENTYECSYYWWLQCKLPLKLRYLQKKDLSDHELIQLQELDNETNLHNWNYKYSIEVLHHQVTRVATVTRPPCWMACTCKTRYDLTRHGEVCCVFNCGKRSERDKNISLHKIPAIISHQGDKSHDLSKIRRERWLANIRRDAIQKGDVKQAFVCSLHFHQDK